MTTGDHLDERRLGDSEFEFGDPSACQSTITKIGPIPGSDHIAVVLTCRKKFNTASAAEG